MASHDDIGFDGETKPSPGELLCRVDTPPLVRHYRSKAAAQEGAISGQHTLPVEKKVDPLWDSPRRQSVADSEDELGDALSPSSLVAGSSSTSAFSNATLKQLPKFSLSDGEMTRPAPRLLYFNSGVMMSELPDSSRHPTKYKDQYTVTGQTRRVKIKREGPPLGRKVTLNGTTIALFKYKGRPYAISSKCCHQGGPLEAGDIEDLAKPPLVVNQAMSPVPVPAPLISSPSVLNIPQLCVACPWHGWRFSLTTGKCINKDDVSQQVFTCKVDQGSILVGFETIDGSQFDPDIDF
mmetsp:Transcript_10576/g.18730  ORF Transcript_10576/g.18730 Transcript_10576/m.18730 type:complete len:294 (-) Transcript_10576:40-921(-)